MITSFQDLLDELKAAQQGHYRDEPQRQDHMLEIIQYILQTMLEKLRDADLDPQ